MAGITIPIAADTRQAAKEVNDLSKGFDKVADSLDDVEKNARATDKLEGNLKDAQRETQKTTDAFEKLGKAQREANENGRSFGNEGTTGLKKLGAQSEEVGGELKQNIGETFSSFRGDITDFGQIAQDTLGGLASGLEGIGPLAAVAAGAAGLGLILGAIEQGQQQSQQWKQDVADLTTQFIEAGKNGGRGLDDLVDQLKTLASTGDDAGVTLQKLNDLSQRSGSDYKAVARAYAGNTDELKKLIRAGQDRVKQLEAEAAAVDENNESQRATYAGLIDQANAQKDLNKYLQDASSKAQEAAKNSELYAKSGAAEMERKAELVKNIDDAYDEAAGSVSDYVNAETGVFDVDAYVKAMEAKAAALDQFKTNMQTAALTLSPDAISFLESQGEEGASKLVQAYVNGTDAQKAALAGIWDTAGKTSADSYTNALKNGVPQTLPGPKMTLNVDTDSAQAQFDRFFRNNSNREVPMIVVPQPGRGVNG